MSILSCSNHHKYYCLEINFIKWYIHPTQIFTIEKNFGLQFKMFFRSHCLYLGNRQFEMSFTISRTFGICEFDQISSGKRSCFDSKWWWNCTYLASGSQLGYTGKKNVEHAVGFWFLNSKCVYCWTQLRWSLRITSLAINFKLTVFLDKTSLLLTQLAN